MNLSVISFASSAEWRDWLEANHADVPGIWLRFAKKGSGIPSVVYREAVDEALCFGWIDGQLRKDEDTARWYQQRFTPRRPRSVWSKINVGRAERLIAEGRMAPAGLDEVDRAKADGRWEAAYDSPATATVPDDLRAALDANPRARASFETLTASSRYALLYRIQTAKRPETRARRIAESVAMLERGETPH